jgi:hypothetical protein
MTIHKKEIKMKSNLLFLFLILTQILSAQTFTEISSPFEGVGTSSNAFSDVNGDGHPDVLITGGNSSGEKIAKLYINDGLGNFTEMIDIPFDGVWSSSIAFSDINGDGNNDVLITGENNSFERIAKLYTNDGAGNFIEMPNTPFDGVSRSSIAFSDVNGDENDDVLITGESNSGAISKLYTNDGAGNFIEMPNTPFDGVSKSSIAFSDINGDGHEDVLIIGQISFSERIAKLYTNDGSGNFTEIMGTPFEGVSIGSIAFSDVNGDGHDDVLITGGKSSGEKIAKLYTNDGLGNFTEIMNTPFDGVVIGSVAFSDVNDDGHNDVLITGESNSASITKLYSNDGLSNFTEIMDTPFEGVRGSCIAFSDVNNDGQEDVLIVGATNTIGVAIAKLYINDGDATSRYDIKVKNNLNIIPFPNPSIYSTIYLSYHATAVDEVTVKVYDTKGILVHQQMELSIIGQQTFSIDIDSLIKGSYFIELDNGKRKGVAQFIVQ